MTVENFDRRLAAGIRWSFAGLTFLLPLLLSTRSSEVFELPKMVFVYAATAVIVGLWLMRMVARREILIRRTPLDIPILLVLISQMVSTIYSIDPHVSWWGWYGRFHGGLWSTISYTLLYYAFVSNKQQEIRNKKQEIRNNGSAGKLPLFSTSYSLLLYSFLASAIIVSGYAILQHFGIDKNFWVQDVVNRVFSTQGQPNWLAAYLVMVIPITWMAAISDIKNHKSYMISYFLFLIYFLALLWTKSRSGLIGLAAADLVFWLLIFFQFYLLKKRSYIDQQRSFKKEPTFLGTKMLYRSTTIVHNLYNFVDRDREKISLINLVKSFVLIHILITGLVLATNNPAREWMAGKLQATSNRQQATGGAAMESGITLRKSEHGGTESGDIRAVVWSGAIQLVKQRPIFGFGPETFGETYWRVRPKEHNLTSEWNFLYNKAHNEWLNLAANTGIFGLGSYLLLILWFSTWSIKRTVLGVRQGQSLINTAILAGVIGVEAVNFFGFSTVTVGVYQYLFMAMAVTTIKAKGQRPKAKGDTGTDALSPWPLALILIFFLAVLYLLSQLFIFFLADLAYNRGRAYQDGGYIEEAVEPLTQAVNLVPGEPVFRAELAEAEGTLAAALPARLTDNSEQRTENSDILSETITQLKTDSIANFEIVRRQSPENLGFVRTQARVLFSLGEYDRAVQLMKLAMEMAPTNPQLPYSLGQMLSKMGNEEEAKVYFNKAVELKPDYAEALEKL